MKRNIIYIALISMAILTSFSACSNFLDVREVGKTTMPDLFSDVDGIRSARTGAYHSMYSYYSNLFYYYPDITGNTVYLRADASNTTRETFNYIPRADILTSSGGVMWRNIYEALGNVNNILHYQPGLAKEFPNDRAELNIIKAEMQFNRALCHFDLCRVFSQPYNYTSDASHIGIPIRVTAPSPLDLPKRNTVKEVYTQILDDLHGAETIFKEGGEDKGVFFVSLRSIQALLARVYLYMEDWDKAIEYATLAMDGKKLARGSEYVSMFRNYNVAGKETIFRLDGGVKKSVTLFNFYNGEKTSVELSNSYKSLFSGISDIRSDSLTQTQMLEDKDGNFTIPLITTNKFNLRTSEGKAPLSSEIHYNPIVLRLSEMYLIRAEAYLNNNKLSEASADVKEIIARGQYVDPSTITVTTSKDELAKIIRDERVKEFSFEGHQLFDITRTKQNLVRDKKSNSIVKQLSYPNDLFIQPIPEKEMEINPNIVGNPTVNN